MRQIREMTSILLLLVIVSMSIEEDIMTTKQNQITLPSQSGEWEKFPVQEDGSFIYAICDQPPTHGVECRIYLIRDSVLQLIHPILHLEGTNSISSLQLRLTGKSVFCLMKQQGSQQEEYVFGVVFDLSSNKTLKLALPSDLKFEDQYIGTIFDSGKAEVVVRNHTVCGGLAQCKLTFNTTGQQLGESVSFPSDYDYLYNVPKPTYSMDKGAFIVHYHALNREWKQIAYFDADGNPTILKTTKELYGQPLFSSTNDLYGFCLQSVWYSNFECRQFDWRTESTVLVNITLSDVSVESIESVVASIANLNGSRFLFTIFDCETYPFFDCRTVRAVTVDSHGKPLKSIPIFGNLPCGGEHSVQSQIAEVDDQFCIYIMCSPIHTSKYFNLYTKCLLKSDI